MMALAGISAGFLIFWLAGHPGPLSELGEVDAVAGGDLGGADAGDQSVVTWEGGGHGHRDRLHGSVGQQGCVRERGPGERDGGGRAMPQLGCGHAD